MIERRKHEGDRRFNRMHPTEDATEVLKTVIPVTQKTEEICTQSPNQKQAVIDSIGGVECAIGLAKRFFG